jgi:hypothetical protein
MTNEQLKIRKWLLEEAADECTDSEYVIAEKWIDRTFDKIEEML